MTHAWAVALWQLRPAGDGPVDITVSGRRVRAAGIRGHESAPPAPADVRWIRGIPVSAPARALLEIAPHTAAHELADLVEKAQVRRLLSRADIATAIKRARSIAGVAALRALAEEQAFTRSRAERRLVALLRSARLPEPIFNAEAEGMEVDALWPRERVVMEFDSYAFHATRAAFERDRRRTAALSRARYVVLRTTWSELTDSSHALVARTAEALALNAPRQ